MAEHKLCPFCATENRMSAPSHEEELFLAGPDGPEIAGKIALSTCEQGHAFLCVNTPNDLSQSFPIWELNIVHKETANIATEKWFGKLCTPEQTPADYRLLKLAVILEAMSKTVVHMNRLVNHIWESSISQIGSESIAELQRDLESVEAE